MDKEEFAQARHTLGKSQSQLAKILCLSSKSIQSFEQGWRKIPTHVEREILLLLMLKENARNNRELEACWEIADCSDEWRKMCIVGELGAKEFCWYLNGTFCHGEYKKNWNDKISVCRECEVFKSMISRS